MTAKTHSWATPGSWLSKLLVGAATLAAASTSFAAATIVIQNGNAAGVGFNDPTPVAPVGGNLGTTLGAQRLNAFQAAANIWGATLSSDVPIIVLATFEPLTCTATSAVLGSAGSVSAFINTPNTRFPNTIYSVALANKLAGVDLAPTQADIRARFNVNLGRPGCLDGAFFYLGLDNNHGPLVDLVTVLLHEFGHGLGFQTFTNGATGAQLANLPSVWDRFLFDNTTNKLWADMIDAERAASALNSRRLAWNGPIVTAALPQILTGGTPQLAISTPASVAGMFSVGGASFGPQLTDPGVTGEIMPVVDSPNNIGLACTPLSAANAAAVQGKIALVDRGICGFNVKVKNAQNAGAIAVIVADNAAGSPPPGLGGADPTVTIPSVRITLADATLLKTALRTRSRTHSGMFGTMGVNSAVRIGADAFGRALMFTPNPFQGGSSVSHYDTLAFPNLLMEPAINPDLTRAVSAPGDLTFELLQDIGW
jgi:hypothetical protein